jgi:hypothetical protein
MNPIIRKIVNHLRHIIIKEIVVAVFLIWMLTIAVNIVYIFYAFQSLDDGIPNSNQKPPVSLIPEIIEFETKTFGEPNVGDTIEIKAEISNKNSESNTVNILIKHKIDEEEKSIYKKTLNLKANKVKKIKFDYLLKKGGEHKFHLYYVINGQEHLIKTISLDVNSYKEDTHFVVTYFHFNVQWRCGDPVVEDRIINGSIRNLLNFYYENPQFKFTFEIQGYAIELMSQDYPEILDIIKKLTERGQMELVVTHYSDQLFIAYPLLDLTKSIEMSHDILKRHNIRRSNVFGAQESQWSPVLPEIMEKFDYDIYVGKNRVFEAFADMGNFRHKYKETCVWETEWNDESIYVVLNKNSRVDDEDDTKTLFYDWSHFGDGERVNTGCNDNDFQFVEGHQKKFENKLEGYEEKDYKFLTISELVYTTLEKDLGTHTIEEIPCCMQGDEYIWTGKKFHDYENDTVVNTLGYRARTSLLALETIIKVAENNNLDISEEKELLDDLWKELLLCEVTDGRGWYPHEVEVDYCITKAENVITICKETAQELLSQLDMNSNVLIETDGNNIHEDFILPQYENVDSPISFNISCETYSYNCYKYSESLFLLELVLNPTNSENVSVSFNIFEGNRCYSPLGMNTYMDIEKFSESELSLMLANGWIYLGSDVSLIKICTTRHVSMGLTNTSVVFKEDMLEEEVIYQFFIFFGEKEDAIEFANNLNVSPHILSEDLTRVILTEDMLVESEK